MEGNCNAPGVFSLSEAHGPRDGASESRIQGYRFPTLEEVAELYPEIGVVSDTTQQTISRLPALISTTRIKLS